MRLQGWASEVALPDIVGHVIVTRFEDPANNSNKYRRFITLGAPGRPHLLITHTGRWTSDTARGIWTGGTYRPQGVAKPTTQMRHPQVDGYNREMCSRKLGGYGITEMSALTTSQIKQIISLAELEDTSPAPAPAPAPTAPTPVATRPISGQPPKTQPSTPVAAPPGAKLPEKISNLLARASSNEDPFDLFADLAILKAEVQAEADRVREMEDQLRLVSEMILMKETA